MHLGAGVGPAVGVSVLRGQGVGLPTVKVPFWPGVRRKSGYSKKFLAEHEADIIIHKAAKKAFDELGVKKLPTVKSLQVEFAELLSEKKAAYAELKKAREELRDLAVHTANYEELRDLAQRDPRKEKEHGRE